MDLPQSFTHKLRQLITPKEKGNKQACMLAVASHKGGVGKTTTCINLATAYTQLGFRVLLVDLDPQAHIASALRIHIPSNQTLSDVLLGRIKDVQDIAQASRIPELYVAGSDKNLSETEMILATKIGKEFILQDALEIAQTYYDFIIFDCPPNLGTLTLNALCAAQHLLIPLDMSVLALEGVNDLLQTVDTLRKRLQRSLDICGLLATRFDKRAGQMNQAIEQSLFDLLGRSVLQTRIPQSSALNKAHMAGEPIFNAAPQSPGALAYRALAEELLPLLLKDIPAQKKA